MSNVLQAMEVSLILNKFNFIIYCWFIIHPALSF